MATVAVRYDVIEADASPRPIAAGRRRAGLSRGGRPPPMTASQHAHQYAGVLRPAVRGRAATGRLPGAITGHVHPQLGTHRVATCNTLQRLPSPDLMRCAPPHTTPDCGRRRHTA